MNIGKIGKRLLSALLILCCLLGLMPTTGLFSTKVEAADTNWDVNGDGTLSILTIGNSFSDDAMEYVYNIASNLGISSISLGNLYIGGCTLATHWSNANSNSAAYTYRKNTSGSWASTSSVKMETALQEQQWDYISMQQASANSGQESTYNSDLTNLVAYVKEKAPSAKLVWHMTWAYQANSTHSAFANYGKNQNTMYSNIVSSVQNKIVTNSDFSIVIPNGTAIQNARDSLIKDNLCRDGYHLNKNIGRYIAGLTLVKALTGLDISGISWTPGNVPNGYKAIAIESANNAVATPFAVTPSIYSNPTTTASKAYYKQTSLGLKANSYWNSGSDTQYNVQITTASNSQYYYSTKRFNTYSLPVGSVITLSGDWQYRPEAWLSDTKQTARHGVTKATYTVCSEEWWKNSAGTSYLYRAFNISKTTSNTVLANNLTSTIESNFKIYIPIEYTSNDLTTEELASQISTLPETIPNNQRVYWGGLSDIKKLNSDSDGKKYLIVSTANYAWDPVTPRLAGTFNAVKVTRKTVNGVERIYGASTTWGIKFTYYGGKDIGNAKAPYKENTSKNYVIAAVKVELPVQNYATDTDDHYGKYLTNRCAVSSGKFTKINYSWQLKNVNYYNSLTANGSLTVNDRKQASRAHIYFKYEDTTDRFHFLWWPQWNGEVSDVSSGNSVRSIYTNPGSQNPYFSMSEDARSDSGSYAKFNLFVIDTTIPNTEALYAKITEAKKYLNTDHTYFSAEYENFLTQLSNAVSKYKSNNGQATSKQSEVNTALSNLTSAINSLNYYNQLSVLKIPCIKNVSSGITEDSQCKNGALNGTYFIARTHAGNVSNVYNFINIGKYVDTNDNDANDSYGIVMYTISGNDLSATNLKNASTLRYREGTTYGYTIQFEGQNFLNRTGNAWRMNIGDAYTFYIYASDHSNKGIAIYDDTKAYVLYCDPENDHTWTLKDKAKKDADGNVHESANRANFVLYQCSPTTLELYRALKFIQPYLDQNEAVKRYPTELYKQFLDEIKAAITDYNNNNNVSGQFTNATTKSKMDALAKSVRGWADKLTMADMTLSYIDMPVEILDFRSDSYLFEWLSNRYTMHNDQSSAGNLLPGIIETANTSNSYHTGLTLDTLVDGNLVYKPETVTYIATLFKEDADSESSRFANLSKATANKEIYKKATSITTLGTFSDTLSKVTPNAKGEKVNGCELSWSKITTYYDLAYYCLNYMWRPVDTNDKLPDNYTYNIVVPERDTLRLYKEANEKNYTIFSDWNTGYNGRYIYNTLPKIDAPTIAQYPDFLPVNGLGFEANGVETDTSSQYIANGYHDRLNGANYHYSIHAYGSFVYYEDQDLYFEFLGDDDVYFFINDKMALDVGGAHSPASASLKLKDKADYLGLVDGEVYTFDMYYIERHTTGSNMKFSTNMIIVDADTLTTNGQYLEINGDNNLVDSTTGMGGEIVDNGLVRVGDTVAYSFDVVNSHDMPIYDLIFEDKTLGTYLSNNAAFLTNEELAFTTTDITDIEVYYRTSSKSDDSITVDSSAPIKKTVDEIKAMINEANEAAKNRPGTSLPAGSYRVTMTSEQDLMDLMALGVPSNCQILIYGFKRLIVEADENTTLTNTMTMSCSYLPWNTLDTEDNVKTLTGSSTRLLKVAALSGIPVANKAEYVMDFAKPVYLSVGDLINVSGTSVKVVGFEGLLLNGYNGEFLKNKPDNLSNAWDSVCGSFVSDGNGVIYTPNSMLNRVDKVYAVYNISGCDITDTAGKARNYPYMLAEIAIVPATNVYYETDFADGVFETTEKQDHSLTIHLSESDVTVSNPFSIQNVEHDTEKGILSGEIVGNDPYVTINKGENLNYVIQKGDVIRARLKLEANDVIPEDRINVKFYFGNSQFGEELDYYTQEASSALVPYVANGSYQVVELAIPEDCVGLTVEKLRFDPVNLPGPNVGEYPPVRFDLDWIYIGPKVNEENLWTTETSCPADQLDELRIDFTETDLIIDERTGYTATRSCIVNEKLDTQKGTLYGECNAHDPFIAIAKSDYSSFNYKIQAGDVVKVRLRVGDTTNMIDGKYHMTKVYFLFEGMNSYAEGYETAEVPIEINNLYQVVAITVPEEFTGREIYGIRFDPWGNDTAGRTYSPNIPFEIDWVYIGPDSGKTKQESSQLDTLRINFSEDIFEIDSSLSNSTNLTYVINRSIDTNLGVLKGEIKGYDPYIGIKYKDTNSPKYTIQSGDVVKVRLKVDAKTNSIAAADRIADIRLLTEGSTSYAQSITVSSIPIVVTNTYQVILVRIPDGHAGKVITGIRIDPMGNGTSGVTYNPTIPFEIDWIYVGPNEGNNEYIFEDFDFGNFTLVNTPSVNVSCDKSGGKLTGTITGIDPYFTFRTCTDGYQHLIKPDDVVKMRIKVDPSADYNETISKAQVFFGNVENNGNATGGISTGTVPIVTDGNYQIITLPIFAAAVGQTIKNLRIDPIYTNSANTTSLTNTSVPFEVDWIYVGPDVPMTDEGVYFPEMASITNAQADVQMPYGYDATYIDNAYLSDGGSLFVEGKGVANVAYILDSEGNKVLDENNKPLSVINYAAVKKYTEASFTFTGTGFDIISRTGADQGGLRVFVCDQDGIIRKTVSVINKGENELYQIPVVSVEMRDEVTKELIYGTYTVHIFVNEAYENSSFPVLNRGGEFYFDAVRIYNPINTNASDADSAYAYALYQSHGEADPTFTEVRQMLIDASKDTSSEVMEGVVYLDTASGTTSQIAEYTAGGPNNEVYLANGNAIAFKLVSEKKIPASVDIGVKGVNGSATVLSSGVNTTTGINIVSSTALNYPLSISDWQTDSDGNYYSYVVVQNKGTGILSLTDIKLAYSSPAHKNAVRFLVDQDLLDAVNGCTEHDLIYMDNWDGSHAVACSNGDYSATEAHSYADGICICGATEIAEPAAPVLDENLTFGAQLYLENDLTLAFRVKPDKLSAYDITTAYLVVEREVYETGAKDATLLTTTISDYTISDDGRVVFSYPGIAAAQMNDTIRATLYVKDANGKEYVSPVVNTSVATYLDGLLGTYANDAEMVTLIMDMLNYGAAAQIYFDRHADALVNEAFESFKTYASYASADFTTALEDLSATENAEGKSGKLSLGLDLGTKIGIQYKVTLPADVAAEDVSLVITDAKGNTLETLTLTGEGITTDAKGRYVVNFYGFTSKDMRRVVYATAYANGEAITGTYSYSISTYAWGIQENASMMDAKLVAVTRAMMLYGDSAQAYFG